MLSPKYAKMFLAEAEQLAKKYKLKPPTHVNSTKGAYSNSLDSSLSKSTKTSYELPATVQNKGMMPVPVGVSGHDVSVLQQRPVLSGALINPLPSTVADVTSAITTGAVKGLEQAKTSWKKWAKGLGLAAAIASGITHFSDDLTRLSENILHTSAPGSERQLASLRLEKELIANNVTDKAIIDKVMKNAYLLNHQDFSKPLGSLVDVSPKGSIISNSVQDVGREHGYNTFIGHGSWNTGVTIGEELGKDVKDLGVVKDRMLSAKQIAQLIKNSENYNPDLPLKMYNCSIGRGHVAQEVADILGTKVIAADESVWMNTRVKGTLGTFGTKDGKLDYSNPGNVLEFSPRGLNERGSVTIDDSNFSRYIQSSPIENIVAKTNSGSKTAVELYKDISKDKYFRKDLPIHYQDVSLSPEKLQDLANIHGQPVRGYNKDSKLLYNTAGFAGAYGKVEKSGVSSSGLKGVESTRDVGTLYYPNHSNSTVKPLTITNKNTPWMDVATSFIGTKESGMSGKGQGSNSSRQIDKFLESAGLKGGYAWCAAFTNFALKETGIENTIKHKASALAYKKFGEKLDRPAYGSIAVFKHADGSGHNGFVVGRPKNNPNKLIILGGNQGDEVNYRLFDEKDVVSFNHPKGYTPDYNLKNYNTERLGILKEEEKRPFYSLPED